MIPQETLQRYGLTTPEFEVIQPTSTDDSPPTVYMSADYGKLLAPGTVLDFDYDAFQASAEKIHGEPIPLGKLAINITPDHTTKGSYIYSRGRDGHEIVIKAEIANGTLHNPAEVQNTTRHELKHFSDQLHGTLDRSRIGQFTYDAVQHVLNLRRVITLSTSTIALGEDTHLASAAAILHSEEAKLIERFAVFSLQHSNLYTGMEIGPMVAVAGIIGASALRYYLDPAEIRARRAGRANHPDIIRAVPTEPGMLIKS